MSTSATSQKPSTQPNLVSVFHDSDLAGPTYLTIAFATLQLALAESGRSWWPAAQRSFWIVGVLALLAAMGFTARATRNLWRRRQEDWAKEEEIQKNFTDQVQMLNLISAGLQESATALQSLKSEVGSISDSAERLHDVVQGLQASVGKVDEGFHRHLRNSNLLAADSDRDIKKRLEDMSEEVHSLARQLASMVSDPSSTQGPSGTPPPNVSQYCLYKAFHTLYQRLGKKPIFPSRLFNALACIDGALDWRVFGAECWDPAKDPTKGSRYWLRNPDYLNLSDWFSGTTGEDGKLNALTAWREDLRIPEPSDLPGLEEAIEKCVERTWFGSEGKADEGFWNQIGQKWTARRAERALSDENA